ncbi:ATP-binding protein [Roseibium sp. TrichSKD4]|uniref:ATP-binding protein n=1 Tax=Roseibium sp. TrichSKD4 TaxID=744980 RepID=UPI0006812D4D|nr:ATP-binding protein [Roseibium sp. TrichSKD4]
MANELVGAAHAENLLGVGEHRRNFQRLSRLFDEGAVELSKAREVVDMMDLAYGREGLFESRRRELSKQLAAQNALFRIRSNASLINNLSGSFAGNAERILSAERDKTTSAIGFAKIVILATGVGAVLIALASAMFVARYVTANITSISNAMMRLAQGDRATRLPQKLAANDEIGILQRSFRVFRANALRLDRMNQRLNRQNALFERVFLNITDGVAITDPEGRLTAVNPSFSKTLRLDPSLNPVGAEIQVVLRSSILAENKSNWRFDESFAGFSEIHGDNGLVIEIRRNALPEGGGVWLFSDATERRQVQDRLRQIQHIEGLGKVAGEVAHDFGNILSSIASNVHLVEQSRTNAQTDTYFYRMRNALEIGTSLVQRLLAFAKKQALMPEVIDLNELIAGLIDLIEVSLKDGVALETQPGVGPNYVLADPGQLESAILNLCLNADQSIKSAGRIRVSIRRPDKSTTVVSVTDTGSGMDKATQLRAFEPFFSTRSGENGTGLGLAMVYGFMKQSGGDAAICSKCGIGTKVSLSFPTAQVASETPREIASGQTALLVEDDPDTMRQTASCLENEGFSVTPASTLEGAMTHLDKIEHLDLLVTDLNLDDGKTGWPLVKQCEDKFADCQIIVVSGRLPERFFDGCEQLKARTVALVEKPFSQEKLESALQGRRCGACA